MIRDPRLHFDPITRPHNEGIEADFLALERSVAPEAMVAMLRPLVVLADSVIRGVPTTPPTFPTTGDLRFQLGFDALASQVLGNTAHRDGATCVLERRLAREVASVLPPDPTTWARATRLFRDWRAWREFADAVPIMEIERGVEGLMRIPSDEATWLESFGELRDDRSAVIRHLDQQRATAADVGAWLVNVERFADHAMLGEDLRLRSELLARLGPGPWLTWAATLPHAVFTAMAANDVEDLDFIEKLIAGVGASRVDPESRRVVSVLLARRAVELLEQVDRSLAGAARPHFPEEQARAEHVASLDAWRATELPARIVRVANALVASDETASAIVARHLRSPSWPSPQSFSDVRASLRERIVVTLGQSDVDAHLSALLGDDGDSAGLLAGAKLVLTVPAPARTQAALDGYLRWCRSGNFIWTAPLDTHDDDLLEAIARVLATADAPLDASAALLDAVDAPPQGWGCNFRRWLKSAHRTTHVLVVVATAASFLKGAGRDTDAVAVIELAWERLAAWLRNAPTRIDNERTFLAVAYVWAFVGRLLGQGAGPRAASRLAALDEVGEIVTAAENYAANLASPQVPVEVQRALRGAFEARLSITRIHPHVAESELEKLTATVHRIAADAYAEAASGSGTAATP
jgi:hypothetical protein